MTPDQLLHDGDTLKAVDYDPMYPSRITLTIVDAFGNERKMDRPVREAEIWQRAMMAQYQKGE